MKLTGISDEAGASIDTQIQAHRELGWDTIESRFLSVDGAPKGPFHDIPDAEFEAAAARLDAAGIGVCAVGSTIANWGHSIGDDFQITLDEIARCIPRMQRVGARFVRIMSYAVLEDGKENDHPDQLKDERFRRLREIKARFEGAGITPVHENCMNYGGMSIAHALETLEAVPGLKWVFDTANPVFNADRSKARPYPRQDAWEFYQAVKPHIAHVHIKDGTWDDSTKKESYTLPGEGQGHVRRILADLKADGYAGYLSAEPHMAVVFHATGPDDRDPDEVAALQYESYITYGRALEKLVASL
ncbi:hypothetical protein BH23VER1_BH23VER1_16030 [soil metagenome]